MKFIYISLLSLKNDNCEILANLFFYESDYLLIDNLLLLFVFLYKKFVNFNSVSGTKILVLLF